MSEHPVDQAADLLGGEQRVVVAWLAVIGVVLSLDSTSTLAVGLALVVFLGGAYTFAKRADERGRTETAIADAQARYVDGEIDEEGFEREVELALDERAQEIRDRVEDVGGVGAATSANIALQFRTLDDVRAADPTQLQDVSGVGPKRATAIAHRLRGEEA